MKAIQITEFGGPDVMHLVDLDTPTPGEGQELINVSAIGINYADTHQTENSYLSAQKLPLIPGIEVVGTTASGVRVLAPVDGGGYAQQALTHSATMIPIPDGVTDEQALCMLVQGSTAWHILKTVGHLQPGETVVVHAAAGGVGQILAGWAKALGAFVVGTVGSQTKFAAAKEAGCDAVVDYSKPNWVEEVLKATGGKKANVVYDSVAKETFLGSLDCTAPFGTVALFGAASGPAPEIQPEILNKKGCLFLTRPSVFPHNATPALLQENAKAVFDAIAKGQVKVQIGAKFSLEQAADAHRAAEGRKVSGAIVMIP